MSTLNFRVLKCEILLPDSNSWYIYLYSALFTCIEFGSFKLWLYLEKLHISYFNLYYCSLKVWWSKNLLFLNLQDSVHLYIYLTFPTNLGCLVQSWFHLCFLFQKIFLFLCFAFFMLFPIESRWTYLSFSNIFLPVSRPVLLVPPALLQLCHCWLSFL